MATTMTFRRALLIVTGWAMTTALMLDFMLACVHAQTNTPNHLSELGRHIVDGTNGRSDDAFLAAIVVVLTFVLGGSMAGAVIYVIQRLVSRLLDQAKEESMEAVKAFEKEMEREREFHSTQIRVLIESDDRQHRESSAVLQRVASSFTEELRAMREGAK